jgi:hypothetical protein
VRAMQEANHDAWFGSLREIRRIIAQIRVAWPEVKIILRGDPGFCRNELMSWCETQGVDFVLGLARNQRLRRIIGAQMRYTLGERMRRAKGARRALLIAEERQHKARWFYQKVCEHVRMDQLVCSIAVRLRSEIRSPGVEHRGYSI